jgi:hypothetical protein
MAAAAEQGDILALGRAFEGLVLGQVDIVLARVPPVTVLAGEPELGVDVGGDGGGRRLELVVELVMLFICVV